MGPGPVVGLADVGERVRRGRLADGVGQRRLDHARDVRKPQPPPQKRQTIPGIRDWKRDGKRFAMVTAYDFVQARTVEDAGIDLILVGDSLSNVLLGHETTLPVTLDERLAGGCPSGLSSPPTTWYPRR